jgi:uncharacterized protein (DUF924 family)
MAKDEQLQQDLTNFMFLRNEVGNLDAMACLSLWFGKSHDTDNEICKRYGELVKQAIAGQLYKALLEYGD